MVKLFNRNAHKVEEERRDEDGRKVIIDIQNISKVYRMGDIEVHALRDVSLKIRQGEFVSIMGPSGSGKSTLMNILGALDQPSGGEYFLDGVDVAAQPERDLASIRNKKIGFVFQSYNLLKRTTALRQVELPLIYAGAANRTERARNALQAVGLERRIDHLPTELSGGQQQRVAIARALVNEPAMILADEATGNLDSKSGTEVLQIFQRLNEEEGITVVFVTHDPWTARHTKRLIMLRDGKVVADQPVPNPLVAGESERPSEAAELESIFQDTYYGGDNEEFN
jgi:putative ABC transport system ATP-binding protein